MLFLRRVPTLFPAWSVVRHFLVYSSFDEQKSSFTFLAPHPARTSPLLKTPPAHRFKLGARKKLLVTKEDFWLALFIWDGKNEPPGCYL